MFYQMAHSQHTVFNKINFNTLAEQYQILPNENIQNIMSSLLQDIPVSNWKPLNWFNATNDGNILEDTEIIYEMQLDDILQLIVEETEEQIYKDTADFEMAKHNFKTFFQKAQMWEKFSVVSSCLGILDLILSKILFFYAKSIVLKIISGLEIIQNYNIVKTSQALLTERIPVFTLPSNYPEADMIQPHKVTISTSTIIVITLMSMIVCFLVYPLSRIVQGKYHTDIFLEVTNTTTCQTIWAHLTKVAVYPSQLFISHKLNSNQINMSKFCCVRQVSIDWNDIMLITNNHKEIQLPNKAAISIWTPTSLNDIEQHIQYDIRIMARVLDHVTEINILPIPTQPSAPIELLGKSITDPRHEMFWGIKKIILTHYFPHYNIHINKIWLTW